jgi:hypothetical protein
MHTHGTVTRTSISFRSGGNTVVVRLLAVLEMKVLWMPL